MKKVLAILALIVSVMTFNVKAEEIELPAKTDHEPVTVYLFYADYCSNCHNFINYFLTNYKDEYKNYFDIVAYETHNVSENSSLAMKVKEYLDVPDENFGWPFIVVGDKYMIGYGSTTGKTTIEDALELYQNDSYKDIVSELADSSVKPETIREAAVTSGLEVPDEKEDSKVPDYVFVTVIFVVVIGGLGSLVYFARK